MKKIIAIAILILFSSQAFAAWTITASVDRTSKWTNGMSSYRVKLSATSDGADVASFALSSKLTASELSAIKGGMLTKVTTVPSATNAPTTFTLALTDELGASLPITVTTTSTTASEDFYTTETVTIWDIYCDFPDIGDASDAVTVYFYIFK